MSAGRPVPADEILRDMERRGLIKADGDDNYVLTEKGVALARQYRHRVQEAA